MNKKQAFEQLLSEGWDEDMLEFAFSSIKIQLDRSEIMRSLLGSPYSLNETSINHILDVLYEVQGNNRYDSLWVAIGLYVLGGLILLVGQSASDGVSGGKIAKVAIYAALCFVIGTISLVTGLVNVFSEKN